MNTFALKLILSLSDFKCALIIVFCDNNDVPIFMSDSYYSGNHNDESINDNRNLNRQLLPTTHLAECVIET